MSAPHTRYKIVESSVVTDEALEAIVNEWVRRGWAFDGMQFAMRESSKRPAMAFLTFTRAHDGSGSEQSPNDDEAQSPDR